ncbi:MAG TPA: ferredoxin [Polyangia bacterium]|nr:ferredoxin [Polyangia bacterium]
MGLNVVVPLAAAAFDAACAPVTTLTLASLMPGARTAVVVGSGGPGFFDRFASGSPEAGDGTPNPLDRYTKRVAVAAATDALASLGATYAVYFPFDGAEPLIPFQRLGRAAGLGGPGPLGLQIHPAFGPWWAYRALVVVDRDLPPRPPIGDGCAGCDAPCVDACPAHAVARAGFSVAACHARRLVAEPCRLSCAARIACVRGPQHRYTDAQLAFHMAASMPRR